MEPLENQENITSDDVVRADPAHETPITSPSIPAPDDPEPEIGSNVPAEDPGPAYDKMEDVLVPVSLEEIKPPSDIKPKKTKKGPLLAFVMIVLLLVAGFAIFFSMRSGTDTLPSLPQINPPEDEVEEGGDVVSDEDLSEGEVNNAPETDNGVDIEIEVDKPDDFEWLVYRHPRYGFSFKYPSVWEVYHDIPRTGIENVTLFRDKDSREVLPVKIETLRSGMDDLIEELLLQQFYFVKDLRIGNVPAKQFDYKDPHDLLEYNVFLVQYEPGLVVRYMGAKSEELADPIFYSFTMPAESGGSLRSLNDSYGALSTDSRYIYCLGSMLYIEHPETFEVVHSFTHYIYARDKENVYFVYANRDTEKPFCQKYILEDADPGSFRYLGHFYTRDVTNAYYWHFKIVGVDINTFQIIDDDFSRDINRVYFGNQVLEGADPKKFNKDRYITSE